VRIIESLLPSRLVQGALIIEPTRDATRDTARTLNSDPSRAPSRTRPRRCVRAENEPQHARLRSRKLRRWGWPDWSSLSLTLPSAPPTPPVQCWRAVHVLTSPWRLGRAERNLSRRVRSR
jgi:hypothetical protein